MVAISKMTGASRIAGMAQAIGLVDSNMLNPPQGGKWFALPTAKYKPIMSCANGIRAYNDAGPAWLECTEPTQATPAVLAFLMASSVACFITKWPMPLSPSIKAIAAFSLTTRILGLRFTPPPLNRVM